MFVRNVFGRTDVDWTSTCENWLASVGMKFLLRDLDYDIAYTDKERAVELNQARIRNNPVPLTPKDVGDIYRVAY